jgi:hypothetical protein
MIDAALGLASDRENWAAVLAIMAFAALLYVLTGRIESKNRRFWINFSATAAVIVGVMIWGAYKAPPPPRDMPTTLLLAKDMGARPITEAGASVELEDVESLKGWGEGPDGPLQGGTEFDHGRHDVDRNRPVEVFDRILREAHLGGNGAHVRNLSQRDWVRYLVGLGPAGRREISSIPFARLRLRASDQHERLIVFFRYDAEPVQNVFGRDEVAICVLRIFNIRESATRGSEAVLLGIGPQGCPNSGRRGIELQDGNGL